MALLFVAATVAVIAVGAVAGHDAREWYTSLERPGLAPAGATYGAVWAVLLAASSVAGWLAWSRSDGWRTTMWWGAQTMLVAVWAVVYFGARSPLGGLVVMVFLIASVAGNVRASSRVDTTAGVLLMPLSIWCLFAAATNIGIVVLNDLPRP